MQARAAATRNGGFAQGYIAWHFPVVTVLLVALTLVAFGDNLFTDPGQPSNSDPKMVIHGIILLAWMVLLMVQAILPRTGRTDLHRRLGKAGFVVAMGVVLSTLWLFVAGFRGFEQMSPEVIGNRILLPSYAICMVGAWRMRARPDWHKRLVHAGTLLLLEPVLARTYDPLVAPLLPVMAPGTDDAEFYTYMASSWLTLFAALLAYDLLQKGRPHAVTLGALAWLVLVYFFAFTV